MKRFVFYTLAMGCLGGWSGVATAGELSLAVASNFQRTAEAMVTGFEADTGHTVSIRVGATGKLFDQIVAGDTVDVFLAGDDARPSQLQAEGLAREVRVYALGALALVSKSPISSETVDEVFAGKQVALADPIAGAYGKAAVTAMERLNLDTATFRPMVVADVGQVATLFGAGAVPMAFVAATDVPRVSAPYVLSDLGPTIPQAAALLDDGEAAVAFWQWMFSDAGRAVIEAGGYQLP